jgi:diguanylate cyclase (GGDEF)-like protein/PAS domain S-box-containing protein
MCALESERLSEAIRQTLNEYRLRQEKGNPQPHQEKPASLLNTLAKVGQSVTSTLELDEVLRRIVDAGVMLTQAEEGFLGLLDEQNGQLYLRAVKNIDEQRINTMRLPVSDSLLSSVIRTGKPYRSFQSNDESLFKVCTGYLVRSLLHVPLNYKGKVLGVLSVNNQKSKRPFTEIDEVQLTSLADYASVAIENARLYEQAQQEIQSRAQVELALRESEERYKLAVNGVNDGLWDWDLKNNLIYYSLRWKSLLGYAEDEIGNTPEDWYERVYPDDLERLKFDLSAHITGLTPHFESEHRMRHKDGSYRWMHARGCAVSDTGGNFYRMAGSQADITDRKIAEERLLHNAFHDTLTGLPNRALFTDHLRHAIARAIRRKDYQFAVLFLDLDRFKDVNDSLGHLVGDQLLVAFARMLQDCLREADIVARLSGDEFSILLEDIQDPNATTLVAGFIKEQLATPFQLGENEVYVTASIGIVQSDPGYKNPDDMLRDADIAMYCAKANGRARYEIFDASMRDSIMDRLALESELRGALEREELLLNYQPIVSLETGELVGFEALVRWQHPRRGLLHPPSFIPMAEISGMIIEIDRWVLREACRQMQAWQQDFPSAPGLTISVNISGKHVAQFDLSGYIEQVLAETGLEPSSLKLEITENTLMETRERTTDQLSRLQALGVHIQIDDFGVGYSSLGYLSQFPINALKIDQTFVDKMGREESSFKIVHSIVTLSHNLFMGVIAEGVETDAQLAHLKELGCEYGQGYLVSSPLPKGEIEKMLPKIVPGKSVFAPWGDE